MDGSVIIYDHEEAGAGDLAVFDPIIFEQARKIIEDGAAENTRRAYRSDLAYYMA